MRLSSDPIGDQRDRLTFGNLEQAEEIIFPLRTSHGIGEMKITTGSQPHQIPETVPSGVQRPLIGRGQDSAPKTQDLYRDTRWRDVQGLLGSQRPIIVRGNPQPGPHRLQPAGDPLRRDSLPLVAPSVLFTEAMRHTDCSGKGLSKSAP